MFEKPATTTTINRRRSSIASGPAPGAIPGHPNTFALPPSATVPRSSTGHGRRSSIQNIAALGLDVGEGSMDMSIEETVDEHSFDQECAAPHQNTKNDLEDEEDDMSMEMTQSYSGGIVAHHQHQQEEEGDESFMTETSTRSDEEKTMEFTIAIGGLLPTQPPSSAKKGRAAVGYNHSDPSGSAALVPGEEDGDMEMDETIAFGGIINSNNVDDTISTNASDDTIQGQGHNQDQGRERTMTFNFGDLATAVREERANLNLNLDVEVDLDMDMDMTTVGGGIHAHQHSHLHAHAHVQSQSQPQQQQNIFAGTSTSTTPKSPHRSLTRPSAFTPSFARPTTSSAQKSKVLSTSPEKPKEKRNIFGPSPSPAKSLATTPRKSGMGIAGEVAKRLSFGSNGGSVHGSAKRRAGARDEDREEEDERVKRQKLDTASTQVQLQLGDSIFGRPRLSASAPTVNGTPRKSLAAVSLPAPARGTPRKSMGMGSTTPAKSPRRSMYPAQTEMEAEDEEVEMEMEMEEEARGENWEPVAIGLASFLQMAGIEFVDSLPTMARRKSGGRALGEARGEFWCRLLPPLFLESSCDSLYDGAGDDGDGSRGL